MIERIYSYSYHHHQIGSSKFPIVVIFPWLCAWCGYAIMLSVSYISRESWVLFLLLLCTFMMCANNRINCGPMVVFVCLYTLYTTWLSSLCRRIWKYRTSKMFVRYILSSVCLRLSQLSQLSFMQYMGLCVFGLTIALMMILRICVLYLIIIIKSGYATFAIV